MAARRIAGIIVILLGVLIAAYLAWSFSGRGAAATEPQLAIDDISDFGIPAGLGNVVGVQPFMTPADYASAEAYHAKLDGYLARAQSEGWLQPDTIIVFPEYIGTWLVAAGEKRSVYDASDINSALQTVVLSNLPRFLYAMTRATGEDKVRDAIFRMKAQTMAVIYTDTFARLARDYGVTIVAGSIVLPEPAVAGGELTLGGGDLQHISLVFNPDGSLQSDIVRKVNPTRDELPFSTPGASADLPGFDTPAGRMGVLICADSWYPQNYEALAAQNPAFVVVPNNETPYGSWHEPWHGYNPGPAPTDVDPADVETLQSNEAWVKYALPGRIRASGAQSGMHVFFHGKMWDLSSDGQTLIAVPVSDAAPDGVLQAPYVEHAALVNYWLP